MRMCCAILFGLVLAGCGGSDKVEIPENPTPPPPPGSMVTDDANGGEAATMKP